MSNERSILTMDSSEIPRPELAERIRQSLRHNPMAVHPGKQSYPLAPKAEAVSIGDLRQKLAEL